LASLFEKGLELKFYHIRRGGLATYIIFLVQREGNQSIS
jgi:hypothetical protein